MKLSYTVPLLLHLLAVIVWVGGMVFAHLCLRPAAAATLEPGPRLRLMHAALARFFKCVIASIAVILLTGLHLYAMSGALAAPGYVQVMAALGILMMFIFGHIYFGLFLAMGRALTANDFALAGGKLNQIRQWVSVNLVLGLLIVALTKLWR